jgi:uncharacterized protein (TIGR03083 family)
MAGVDSNVVVVHLLSPERTSLIELLSALGAEQWQAPTAWPGWSVKDVGLHLVGNDFDLLSRRRDAAAPADRSSKPASFQELDPARARPQLAGCGPPVHRAVDPPAADP